MKYGGERLLYSLWEHGLEFIIGHLSHGARFLENKLISGFIGDLVQGLR